MKRINAIDKKALIKPVLAAALLMLLLSALTYVTVSWMINMRMLNTVAMVEVPAKISILDADHSALTQIDLRYEESDRYEEGIVRLRRPICIESTAGFYLELAYTTNIDGLTCKLYPATKGEDGRLTAGSTEVGGSFLNKDAQSGLATDALHEETYGNDAGITVQKNAEPLYWMTEQQSMGSESAVIDGLEVHYTYYVLSVEWDSNQKETDILYLMAIHSGAVH